MHSAVSILMVPFCTKYTADAEIVARYCACNFLT